jgi:hypothetical protein
MAGISAGIYYEAGNTTVTEISNNLIYNIKSIGSNTSFTGGNAYGLYIGSGGNLKILHNTIWMEGNYLTAATGTISSCVNIRNSITNIDFRNNLLKNSLNQFPAHRDRGHTALRLGTALQPSVCWITTITTVTGSDPRLVLSTTLTKRHWQPGSQQPDRMHMR